jgi:hypothetical protein
MNSSSSMQGNLRRVQIGVTDHGMLRLQPSLRETAPPPEANASWPRRIWHHTSRWLLELWAD